MNDNLKFLNDLKVNVRKFYSKFKYEPLKNKMKKFYEDVIYSDPVSSPDLYVIEDEINRKFSLLVITYANHEFNKLDNIIDDLISLIEERNYNCKIGKN